LNVYILVIAIALSVLNSVVVYAEGQVDSARLKWSKWLERMSYVDIKYACTIDRFPTGEEKGLNGAKIGDLTIMIASESSFGTGELLRRHGNWRSAYEHDSSLRGNLQEGFFSFTAALSDDRFERHMISHDDLSRGTIAERGKEMPTDQYCDIGLGIRLLGQDKWLDVKDLDGFRSSVEDDSIEFSSTALSGHVHTWSFRWNRESLEMTKYVVVNSLGDRFFQCNVEEWSVDGEFSFAKKFVASFLRQDGSIQRSFSYVVNSIVDPVVPDLQIEWPIGTHVLDSRTGANILVQSKKKKLDDDTLSAADTWMKDHVFDNNSSQSLQLNQSDGWKVGPWIIVNIIVILTVTSVLYVRRKRR